MRKLHRGALLCVAAAVSLTSRAAGSGKTGSSGRGGDAGGRGLT